MGIFDFLQKDNKKDHSFIYDNGDDSGIDYSDLSEELEDVEGLEDGPESFDPDELDDTYEDVYTLDGDTVACDWCGSEMKVRFGQYICPDCGKIMSRSEFMNYIGIDPSEEDYDDYYRYP